MGPSKQEAELEKLKKYSYWLTLSSITALYGICAVGICISNRPGLPSISRIIADNPLVMPVIYLVFCVATSFCSILILAKANMDTQLVLAMFQSLFILMIVVADLDNSSQLHFASATMIVIVTMIRGIHVVWWTKRMSTKVFQITLLVLMFVCSGTFVLFNTFYIHAELTTSVALSEYLLFLSVAANYNLYMY